MIINGVEVGGRPEEYKPEYCDKVIEIQRKGSLTCDICAELDISRATLYRWRDKHEEFNEALLRGRAKAESYWANQLKEMIIERNDKGCKACIMILNNNFGWGKDGTPPGGTTNNIQIGNVNVLQTKSEKELIEIIQDKLKTLPVIDVKLIDNESTE